MGERHGMCLTDVLSKFTHRQFRTWLIHEQNRVYHPDRSDYYLMKIMAMMESMVSKENHSILISDYAIRPESEVDRPASDPAVIARSQAAVMARTGYKGKKPK